MSFFTARVRSAREGNVLTPVCVSVHTCRGGYPIPGLAGEVPHPRSGQGVPHPRSGLYPLDLGQGTPPDLDRVSPQTWDRVPPRTWDRVPPPRPGLGYPPSIVSTCYEAGGMPLAFTQEVFLVVFIFSQFNSTKYVSRPVDFGLEMTSVILDAVIYPLFCVKVDLCFCIEHFCKNCL